MLNGQSEHRVSNAMMEGGIQGAVNRLWETLPTSGARMTLEEWTDHV